MTTVELAGYLPGALGEICAMQARYYSRDWGFGRAFEAKVAADMAEFLGRFDPACDLFQVAQQDGRIVGSITVDGGQHGEGLAHLRWFCVADGCRGHGIGARLMAIADTFAAETGCKCLYLWTFAGLDPARHVYERAGMQLVQEFEGDSWGTRVVEQKFEKHY